MPAPTETPQTRRQDRQSIQDPTHRPLDPNVRQRRASAPDSSVWVNASAGTGKTKVLTDRVLRLLLPRNDGTPGTPPYKILCLTFTKAAAAEMALRINKTLSEWAVMEDAPLQAALKKLTGAPPSPAMIAQARQLFVQVLDTPGGLNMMTIHAFCQSVLGRFPVEAAIAPHFEVIDEVRAKTFLLRARDAVLNNADTRTKTAIDAIAAEINEDQFAALLSNLCSESLQLRRIWNRFPEESALNGAVCAAQNADKDKTPEQILRAFCAEDGQDLQPLCAILQTGGKPDQKIAAALQRWIEMAPGERAYAYPAYASALITTKGTPRAIGKKILTARPETALLLNNEVQRILTMEDRRAAAQSAALTTHLMVLGRQILDAYDTIKIRHAALDYEDLIARTLALLQGEKNSVRDSSWVLFKLDGGLDHILIDEAQDTNPEQWQIISNLAQEFFTGESRTEEQRTLFVVGDEKQSIYSFQRAAPEEFETMRAFFAEKIKNANQQWSEEDMIISFRSTKSILTLVDTVFSASNAGKGLGAQILTHESFRRGQAGHAELWPLFEPPEKDDPAPWSAPADVTDRKTAPALLADAIAKTIADWLKNGEMLVSRARPIRPGDIMVLVRTRTAFVNGLVRALKGRGVPVSGVDRLVLSQALAVQDLLAMAEFALLPTDDLTLASILKSPLIGLDEHALYDLAAGRPGSLWTALQKSENPIYAPITAYLRTLITNAHTNTPYDFFSRILQTPCPAHRQSGLKAFLQRLGDDCLDPLDEFLAFALQSEGECGASLQRFTHTARRSAGEIKRELDEAGGAVRIMTIHAAKGLQAPIVFLPDTTRTTAAKRTNRLLWPDKTGADVPLWAPRKALESKRYKTAFAALEGRLDDEYRRLLYVALTRAEDRIYIAGAKGVKGMLEESWHSYIAAAFSTIDHTHTNPDTGSISFSNAQTAPPDRPEEHPDTTEHPPAKTELPNWLFRPMPEEEDPPRPLTPSRPSEPDAPVLSPLKAGQTERFKRGAITHTLLQILPDIDPAQREQAARRALAHPAYALPEDLQNAIAQETLAVLNHPDFAPIFGPGSMAEVPVTGLLDDKTLISGQIDRLLVTAQDILIIDYKTNRPPPSSPQDVPAQYKAQLTAYACALEKIYPGRPVRTALLWTDTLTLMEIS